MNNAHEAVAARATRWCPGCDALTVTVANGSCPWCETAASELGPVAPVATDLQRAFEATTLMHLTEPRTFA